MDWCHPLGYFAWLNVWLGVLIMGMSMHDRYYEPEDDEDFDEQVAELLNGDYNPDLPENIQAAIMDDALYGDHWELLVEAIQKNDKPLIGLIVSTCIYEYWENRAESDCHP
jgi:hypothetical protein